MPSEETLSPTSALLAGGQLYLVGFLSGLCKLSVVWRGSAWRPLHAYSSGCLSVTSAPGSRGTDFHLN